MSDTNTNTKRSYVGESIYIDGNVVPSPQPAPKRQPEVRKKSRRQLEEERARKRAVNRNVARAMAFGRGYIIFLSVATAVCLVVCLTFIYLQSSITSQMASVAALETTLSNERAANDLAESRLETSMTLDEIKTRADEMGLVYPSTSQIQYFSVTNSDYMNQYTEVASK